MWHILESSSAAVECNVPAAFEDIESGTRPASRYDRSSESLLELDGCKDNWLNKPASATITADHGGNLSQTDDRKTQNENESRPTSPC